MPSYRQADNARTSKASSNCVKCGKGLKTVSLEGWHLDLDTWFPAGGNVLRVWETFKTWGLTGEGGSLWVCLEVCIGFASCLLSDSWPTQMWAVFYPCYHDLSGFQHPTFPTLLPASEESRSRDPSSCKWLLMPLCQVFNHRIERSTQGGMSGMTGFGKSILEKKEPFEVRL